MQPRYTVIHLRLYELILRERILTHIKPERLI